MKYDEIRYGKNFIKQVVCRFDFLDFFPNDALTSPDITVAIRKAFQVPKMPQVVKHSRIGVVENTSPITPPSVSAQAQEGILLEFTTSDAKNKLIISDTSLVLDFSNYSTFEEMLETFCEVLRILYKREKFTVLRTGLRYINILEPPEIIIRKTYLAKALAYALDAPLLKTGDNVPPIRSFSLNEYRTDRLNTRFRYGLYNKNNLILSKDVGFVLDYDCFTLEPIQEFDSAMNVIKEAHINVQTLFENSITDALREIMRNG